MDDPHLVQVERAALSQSVIYEVTPGHIPDLKKLIGRRGRLLQAIQRVMAAAYGRVGVTAHVHVIQPRE